MSYTAANLRLLIDPPFLPGAKFWTYTELATAATVAASGYITDGADRGMRDGDLLLHYNSLSKIWTAHTVTVSGMTVDLADGTTVGSGTDSD